MITEEKKSQTQEQEEFLSVNVPDNHQSENASEKCGLVSVERMRKGVDILFQTAVFH